MRRRFCHQNRSVQWKTLDTTELSSIWPIITGERWRFAAKTVNEAAQAIDRNERGGPDLDGLDPAFVYQLIQLRSADPGNSHSLDISQIDFDKLRTEFPRSPKKNTTVQSLKDAIQYKLDQMLRQNPLRTDFQQHYEELVASYNDEKDAVTIETTFAALLKLVEMLDVEQQRAVREGLDEDTLALFDLLLKPDLDKGDIKRLKAVAVGLYDVLKAQMDAMQDFVAKQATRDRVRVAINDFLYDDQTGLPESYLPEEVDEKAQAVFAHLLMQRRADFHV